MQPAHRSAGPPTPLRAVRSQGLNRPWRKAASRGMSAGALVSHPEPWLIPRAAAPERFPRSGLGTPRVTRTFAPRPRQAVSSAGSPTRRRARGFGDGGREERVQSAASRCTPGNRRETTDPEVFVASRNAPSQPHRPWEAVLRGPGAGGAGGPSAPGQGARGLLRGEPRRRLRLRQSYGRAASTRWNPVVTILERTVAEFPRSAGAPSPPARGVVPADAVGVTPSSGGDPGGENRKQ